jgi:hypothetical protein
MTCCLVAYKYLHVSESQVLLMGECSDVSCRAPWEYDRGLRSGTMLLSPVEDLYGFCFWILDRTAFTLRTRLLGSIGARV